MSWKRIKTFLIILFLIINLYLILSTGGIKFSSTTSFDKNNISKTVDVIKKNFDIDIDKNDVLTKISNLNIIDVDNIIYSNDFSSKHQYTLSGSEFKMVFKTSTSSYSENTAKNEFVTILKSMNISEGSYDLVFENTDSGPVCIAYEKVENYPIFNGCIKGVFSSKNVKISGRWFFAKTNKVKSKDTSLKMVDISGVLLDMASVATSDESSSPKCVTAIEYGYYVGSYDENTVSKTASAVPCYMIETDFGSKYYYDAINGNLLKQED